MGKGSLTLKPFPFFFLALLYFGGAFNSYSSDLNPVPVVLNAKVMPKGIRSLRYNRIYLAAENQYSPGGQGRPLSELFTRSLTYKDLVSIDDSTAEASQRGQLEGYLKFLNKNLDSKIGDVKGDISVSTLAHVPIAVYGLTPKLTMALALPIINYDIKIDSGFSSTSELRSLQEKWKKERRNYELQELIDKISDPIQTAVEEYNYKPLRNDRGSKWGDLKLALKYQVLEEKKWALALTNEWTIPTGKVKDVDKLVDIPGGDGQWDLGLGGTIEFNPLDNLSFSSSLGVTLQLPDHSVERIPFEDKVFASPDKDSRVNRDLGDHYFFQVGAEYNPLKGFYLRLAYNFQLKDADQYSGDLFESKRYGFLPQNRQMSESILVGAQLTTIPWVIERKILLPLEINFNMIYFTKGKNIVKDNLFSLEFATYF